MIIFKVENALNIMKMEDFLKKCVNYSLTPILTNIKKSKKGYIYLYKTTNLITGNIYVGLRVYNGLDVSKELYLGNGFRVRGGVLLNCFNNKTDFAKEIYRYGFENFKKEIICFFENKVDGLQSEQNVVDEDFISKENVLNMVVGGGKPPTGCGEKNNNYGNYWTREQKISLSRKLKQVGHQQGSKNNKANPCIIFDMWKKEYLYFTYRRECRNKLGFSPADWLVGKFRYLCLPNGWKGDIEEELVKINNPKSLVPWITNKEYFKGISLDDLKKKTGFQGGYLSRFLKVRENEDC